jgi:hypothetical protein
VLYFAYGSNMDPTQMQARCPDARFVSLACLNGHVLCFPRRSKTRGCGVSSILAKDGCETWGVIYELSDADLADGANVSLMPEVVEHLGGVSYAYTDAGRDSSLMAEVRGKPGLKVGNELRLSVRPVDCLLFDGDGKRL